MQRFLIGLRSYLFLALYAGFTTAFSLLAIPFVPFLPYKARLSTILIWNRFVLFLARWVCGIRYRVHGLENLPNTPYVAISKHQSAWETFILLLMLRPVSIVLKQELLSIPGFGWGLRMLKPIPIDRDSPRQAIRDVREKGLQRLTEEKMAVLVFPEGTRVAVGETGKYARSGASLAIDAGVPVVFISHNAGYFWPSTHALKYPGTIDLYISAPINTAGREAGDLTRQAQEWIEQHIVVPDPKPQHYR